MAKSSYIPQMPSEKLLLKALLLYVSNNPGYLDSERNPNTLRCILRDNHVPQKLDALFGAASRTPKLFDACNTYDKFRNEASDNLMVNILFTMMTALADPTLTLGELYCIAESEV